MVSERELLQNYHSECSNLENQEDELKRGEQTVNNLIDQTSDEINHMLGKIEGDTSEASAFARYRLNQLFEDMNENFRIEKKQVQNKREQVEVEFNQQLKRLQEKD